MRDTALLPGAARSLLESCRTYASQLNEEDRADFLEALSVVIATRSCAVLTSSMM